MKKPKQKIPRKAKRAFSRVPVSPLRTVLPNLAKWCEGKPIGVRILAKVLAVSPEEVTDGMNEIHHREFPNPYPVKDPERWHQCYYRKDIMKDYILQMMFNGDDRIVYKINKLIDAFREVASMPRERILETFSQMTASEITFEYHCAFYFWRDLERRVDQMIVDMENSAEPNKVTKRLLPEPEVQFFARVWAPCWFAHRLTPLELLDLAKNPDFDKAKPAMLKLFRLDPSLILVSPFKELMHQLSQNPAKQYEYQRLTNVLNSAPIAPANLPSTKAIGAAPLLALAKACKCKLNANDIRKLYDASAKDRYGRNDLDNSDHDTYRKRIQRESSWLKKQIDAITGTIESAQKSQ